MKILLIYSGGLDSTTLLHHLLGEGHQVACVSFNYGQKHAKELDYAQYWAKVLGVSHEIVNLVGVFAGSALTGDKPMPQGHYSEDSMKQTVVPNRNMVMLAIAASKAIQMEYEGIAYAAHADDRGIYPDCRQEFVDAMRVAFTLCDWLSIQLITPFIGWSKAKIYHRSTELGVDVKRTWSCYEGLDEPCGKCGACSARKDAENMARSISLSIKGESNGK